MRNPNVEPDVPYHVSGMILLDHTLLGTQMAAFIFYYGALATFRRWRAMAKRSDPAGLLIRNLSLQMVNMTAADCREIDPTREIEYFDDSEDIETGTIEGVVLGRARENDGSY